MFGVRPQPLSTLQDENAGDVHLSMASRKENALGSRTFGDSKAGLGAGGAITTKGLSGQRKAFGNITNSFNAPSENAAVKPQGKIAPAKPEGRRAFGDLTNNSAASNRTFGAAAAKPAPSFSLRQPFKSSFGKAVPVQVPEAVVGPISSSAADGEPVERLAGKGWEQLEAERQVTQSADIEQRAGLLKSAMASWNVGSILQVRTQFP